MVSSLYRSEVNNIITNDLSSFHGLIVRTELVLCRNNHRYWHLFDLREVNKGHLPCTLLPPRSVLLETIRVVGVLQPMNFIHDRYWLELTCYHFACFLAQLCTNLFIVFLPSIAGTTEAIDAKLVVIVEVLEHLLWALWRCDCAGRNCDKLVEAVSQELLFEM